MFSFLTSILDEFNTNYDGNLKKACLLHKHFLPNFSNLITTPIGFTHSKTNNNLAHFCLPAHLSNGDNWGCYTPHPVRAIYGGMAPHQWDNATLNRYCLGN